MKYIIILIIMTTKIIMENNNDFNFLLIKPGPITQEWNHPNYISMLMKLKLTEAITTNCETYLEMTTKYLDIVKYNDVNVTVITEIIADEPNYLYELLYVDLSKETKYHDTENEFGTLININGDKIYSNVIILKTLLPCDNESMHFISMHDDDLERILYNRVYCNIVVYRNYELVKECVADLIKFADTFFEGEYYKKIEMGFLAHNINIWYVSELGEKNVCGKLVNDTIEKCIIFTMNNDNKMGNITLDEVNKIIFLSNVLPSYIPESDALIPKTDNLGRLVIKNKYRILDEQYKKIYSNNI
jgi:hypothetical protein